MKHRLAHFLEQLYQQHPTRARLALAATICLLITPMVILLALSLRQTFNDLMNAQYTHQAATAHLAATNVAAELRSLQNLGISLVSRPALQEAARSGAWQQAIQSLESIPHDFPLVDRIFIADKEGTLLADYPPLPGVQGVNFAYRDWFQGVSKEWKPYISETYQRAAEPRFNVVALAIPIKRTGSFSDDGEIFGILVLQIQLNHFWQWTQHIDVGPGGAVYLVDQHGHIIAHPRLAPQEPIQSVASASFMENLLQGNTHIKIARDPLSQEEHLVAYEPIPPAAWVVVVSQPLDSAFQVAMKILRDNILFSLAMIGINVTLVLLLAHTMHIIGKHSGDQL